MIETLRKACFFTSGAIVASIAAMPVAAYAQEATYRFDIPSQDMAKALRAFGKAARQPISFDSAQMHGKRSVAVRGSYSANDALRILLDTSGLTYRRSPQGVVIVSAAASNAEQFGLSEAEAAADPIVVTGSRIQRAGFSAPTPTTVVGEAEMRQGARGSVQQIVNDLPQMRATVSQQTSGANLGTGVAPVDLRGLGLGRTLALLDGRRFVGQNNLNFIPMNLVKRIEVVTGGASAAWGSGAVSGVVNIILDDKLSGLRLGASNSISSRGDAYRYALDGSFGASFADGRGHVMFGIDYVREDGVFGVAGRPNLSGGIVRVNPTSTTDLSTRLVRDVNYGNSARDGLITSGVLAGNVFNSDGTLRRFRGGTQVGAAAFNAQMIGGEDGLTLSDLPAISAPSGRVAAYGRVTFDLGGAKIWADASYGRVDADNPRWIPDVLVSPITVQATNPFLSAAVRNQLAAAGETSFTYGREFSDIYSMGYDAWRENKEVAVGISGDLGRFKYRAHFSHGEIYEDEKITNSRLPAQYTRAISAATNSAGQIVCAVNADAITTNDDPACRPLNIFGTGNASAEALAYTTGTQARTTSTKLDSTGVELSGDLIDLWAGPLAIAIGAEARWEEIIQRRDAFTTANTFLFTIAGSDLSGGFNVKEGFVEVGLPLIDVPGTIKAEVNGAARYSDYSTSGGIWSWKLGGTIRLFNDFLLRGTRSRDIRSPAINELFATRIVSASFVADLDTAGRAGVIPGYVANPLATSYSGGNPELVPEVSKGLTLGATWSPSFAAGLSFSADYYDIDISKAIATLSASNLTLACARGSQEACSNIVRNPTTQTLEAVFANAQNIARFQTRGLDLELSYATPMSRLNETWDGMLRLRALATYVDRFILDTRVTRVDTAGDVGNSTANAIPDWRGMVALTYESERLTFDARLRYVNGGKYNSALTTLINNDVSSKTYVDLSASVNVANRITLFGNVNNLFNVAPPLGVSFTSVNHDVIGTYFTAGARLKF